MTSQEHDAYKRGYDDGMTAYLFEDEMHPPPRVAPRAYFRGWCDGWDDSNWVASEIEKAKACRTP